MIAVTLQNTGAGSAPPDPQQAHGRAPTDANGNNPFRSPVGAALRTTGQTKTAAGTSAVVTTKSTLVLYDTTGPYGWLGELYATATVNLASHFGSWTAKPVSTYAAGEISAYTATVYIGSTYDEPLPQAFLDDVLTSTKPIVWVFDNIWQLTNRWAALHPGGAFAGEYGWMWSGFDFSAVNAVTYKATTLRRDGSNAAGMMNYSAADPAAVLAYSVRTDGTTFPWAVRGKTLTYLSENPFVYTIEGDRELAFEDLLFDALAPETVERHRALVRLEDIDPTADPASLRAIADYLSSKGVPFSFGVIPVYTDPNGYYNGGVAEHIRLRDRPALVKALKYLQQKGGTLIQHGWTHQYSNVANPYDGVSGDDFEFYRVVENPDFTLSWVGPLTEDTAPRWTKDRVNAGIRELSAVNLTATMFETPHYSGSARTYAGIASLYSTRYERALYFRGVLSHGTVDHSRLIGQRFSYVVRDVYGTKVLPENLGCIETEPFHQFPVRFPADIIDDAHRARVVRDGFASFYFHPFFDISLLRETVEGLQQAGYVFVSPAGL